VRPGTAAKNGMTQLQPNPEFIAARLRRLFRLLPASAIVRFVHYQPCGGVKRAAIVSLRST
jgi:hypothetical protein